MPSCCKILSGAIVGIFLYASYKHRQYRNGLRTHHAEHANSVRNKLQVLAYSTAVPTPPVMVKDSVEGIKSSLKSLEAWNGT